MPTVQANGITMSYEKLGQGEPLVLIPYLAADQACYAFQVAECAKHFECISLDGRGAGLSDKPEGTYTTEPFADDTAAIMQAIGLERAHVAGLSLGAATAMCLAAKYPPAGQYALAAQCLAEERRIPTDSRRGLAGDGARPQQHSRQPLEAFLRQSGPCRCTMPTPA